MNTPINFEIAKLLKKKGFDRETLESYEYRGVEHQEPSYKGRLTKDKLLCDILAPTISEVVMWLYENHKIWISVTVNQKMDRFTSNIFKNYSYTCSIDRRTDERPEYGWDNPTEAYEAAIEYTLNNLI